MYQYRWDKGTHRKVMLVGTLLCFAFIAVSMFLKPQAEGQIALRKADKLIRTVGSAPLAH